MLTLCPVTRKQAQRFIARHHRHNDPSISAVFGVGVSLDGELVGVAMVGVPKARRLMDGATLEVTRTCVKPDARNANSMLYGACARAAAALGYARLITYTLASESGASLRGAGWTCEGDTFGELRHAESKWESHAWKSGELFPRRIPEGAKRRWVKRLA